jgi:hypothetical protein
VQQQSAGFVQQNQQLQDAQNAASPSAVVLPGGTTAAGASARGAANAANPANPESGEKAGSTPATPPPPPPPPPTYVSVVKHLTPGPDSADPAGTTAIVTAPAAAAAPPAVAPETVKTETSPAPAKATAPLPLAAAPTPAAADVEKIGASERVAETGVVSGGRGPAPEGYTFYVGFGIALLLLVIAFGAYMSSQKDEAGRRVQR